MIKMLTRQRLCIFMLSLFCLFTLFSLGNKIQAAEYPIKPIIFLCQGEGGSQNDIMMRVIAQRLSPILGKPVMVVNKPGAGGSIALKEIHDAKPDGYTIGAANATIVSNKLQGISLYGHRDFSILCINTITYPNLIASTKTKRPFKTVEEVISIAKAHPGEVSMATSGVGYIWWIAALALQEMAGIKFNIIPQPGTSAAVATAVAGGHTDLGINTLAATRPHIDAGNVRFLAMFAPKRAPEYPNVPTFQEAVGYDLGVASGSNIIGPSKIPKEIVDKLVNALGIAMSDPEYIKLVQQFNDTPSFLPTDKALKYFDELRDKFRPIMDKAGILKEK